MYDKFSSALHALNIVFQAFYSLAMPIGIGALASYLLTEYTSVGKWIWALLLILGTFTGLYSMVRYVLNAMNNLERFEAQREKAKAEAVEKERRRAKLREDLSKNEDERG